MLTLPKIVQQIRSQQPGAVPECDCQTVQCPGVPPLERYLFTQEDGSSDSVGPEVAIAVVEAALWRVFYEHKSPEANLFFWNKDPRGWCVYGMRYGNDELALIRALCQVIRVRLEDADG